MRIEEKIFNKAVLLEDRLTPFGFRYHDGVYSYSENFLDDAFKAEIQIIDGKLQGKVIDTAFGEEYLAFNVDALAGGYVGEVREAYKEILLRIKSSCFRETVFVSAQANRIAKLIHERFDEDPDFPFKKMENYGVFRYPETKKWYGLIMNMKRGQVTKEKDDRPVDVLNLKIDTEKREEILQIKGIYQAFHMSHAAWATILLDEEVPDETIMELIAKSREFAMKGKVKARKK